MKMSCQCGNAVYQLAKKVPIFIVKLLIGGLLNLLKLIQTDFTLDSVIFCQTLYKRPLFKGTNNIWNVMNLIILRVLFKKGFTAIKRFLQFQVCCFM